ncbi:MAG: hypothetical protein AAF215_18310 [Cyanobacteria bacterium P01_A01_bin.123]
MRGLPFACAETSTTVVETQNFRLTADPVDYQDLDSQTVIPHGEAFSLSFYDFDPSWEQYIRTVEDPRD